MTTDSNRSCLLVLIMLCVVVASALLARLDILR